MFCIIKLNKQVKTQQLLFSIITFIQDRKTNKHFHKPCLFSSSALKDSRFSHYFSTWKTDDLVRNRITIIVTGSMQTHWTLPTHILHWYSNKQTYTHTNRNAEGARCMKIRRTGIGLPLVGLSSCVFRTMHTVVRSYMHTSLIGSRTEVEDSSVQSQQIRYFGE